MSNEEVTDKVQRIFRLEHILLGAITTVVGGSLSLNLYFLQERVKEVNVTMKEIGVAVQDIRLQRVEDRKDINSLITGLDKVSIDVDKLKERVR